MIAKSHRKSYAEGKTKELQNPTIKRYQDLIENALNEYAGRLGLTYGYKDYKFDLDLALNTPVFSTPNELMALRTMPELEGSQERASMAFVADNLFHGRKIRTLTIVDNFSRQCLAIHVGQSLKGEDIVAAMTRLQQTLRLVPKRIQVDNGSEFISKALDRWAYDQPVTLDCSRPGKPTDNPYIESFNGSFRDECLSMHLVSVANRCARKTEYWRQE